MNLEKRIDTLDQLHDVLSPENPEIKVITEKAYEQNPWFTPGNIFIALKNIREKFLQKEKLERWLASYSIPENITAKAVGIIMAGNLPLVGFHDFLCVLLSGHRPFIKLSSKDNVLFAFVLEKLFQIDKELPEWIIVSERLNGMDAMIATGSNNSSRYFEYYFGKYPHIIRKNRTSVAVLTGKESKEDLEKLGNDIFSFFGLGCRNVSKLYAPENYRFDFFFEAIEPFRQVAGHTKYFNNYEYNRTLLLMNNIPHLTNDFLLLREEKRLISPVAEVFYEHYTGRNDLDEKLSLQKENIQCIIGENYVPFGAAQSPELWDYADNVDTMKFLTSLGEKHSKLD
ncbi:MAG: acyl-CoA reductase [Chitinophagales bacterium]|nr:acyl-CoA reductase [Chitinophagales bacterium]